MQAGTQTFEVEGVTSGSSAAQAGLREGLILEKLDRVKVTGWTQQKLDKTCVTPRLTRSVSLARSLFLSLARSLYLWAQRKLE